MCFYKTLIILSLVSLLSACSEKVEKQGGEDIHPSFSELPEVSEGTSPNAVQRVVPVQLSSEDKAKADKEKALGSLSLLLENGVGIGDHSTEDFYNNLDEALNILVDAVDRLEVLEFYLPIEE